MEQLFPQNLKTELLEKKVGSDIEKEKNNSTDAVFEKKQGPDAAVHEALGVDKVKESDDIQYIYHRTMKKNAESILVNGFRLKTDGAKRIECGNGVYSVTSLEDINNPYNKKHYGNYIVRIGYDSPAVDWNHGEKTHFMKLAKSGINGNNIYKVAGVGEVAVLCDIDKIKSIEISKDNGKTWIKSELYNEEMQELDASLEQE